MINLKNFTAHERNQLAEIKERVSKQRSARYVQGLEAENLLLRRLLLEAVVSMLHHRQPNDEFISTINQVLRFEKFK